MNTSAPDKSQAASPERTIDALFGTLNAVGTPPGTNQPRALVLMTEAEIRAVKHLPMLQSVAIITRDAFYRLRHRASLADRLSPLEDQLARYHDFILANHGHEAIAPLSSPGLPVPQPPESGGTAANSNSLAHLREIQREIWEPQYKPSGSRAPQLNRICDVAEARGLPLNWTQANIIWRTWSASKGDAWLPFNGDDATVDAQIVAAIRHFFVRLA